MHLYTATSTTKLTGSKFILDWLLSSKRKDSECDLLPNLAVLAMILLVLPRITAIAERSFNDMKLVRTQLRSRVGEDTLDEAMHCMW